MKYLTNTIIVLLVFGFESVFGQTPPAPVDAPPIKITGIKVETAALPGSSLLWTKVIIGFTSTDKWADGIVFAAQAVLGDAVQSRVVLGAVRYANVPAGTHNAILYISPRATARFGKPLAVKANCLYKDREIASATWQDPNQSPPDDWTNLNQYPGVMVNVLSTPWILLDYEKAPDVLAQ